MARLHAWRDLARMSRKARPEAYTAIQAGIGARIRSVREVYDIGQAETARVLGIHQSTLAKIERGTRTPSIFNVIEIANRFRVSADFLLRGHLNAKTDEEVGLLLAAKVPHAVLPRTRTDRGTDTDRAGGKYRPPKAPKGSS